MHLSASAMANHTQLTYKRKAWLASNFAAITGNKPIDLPRRPLVAFLPRNDIPFQSMTSAAVAAIFLLC